MPTSTAAPSGGPLTVDDSPRPVAGRPLWRRAAVAVLRVVTVLGAVIVGVVLAALTFVVVAVQATAIPPAAVLAIVVFAGVVAGGTALGLRGMRNGRRWSVVLTGGLAVVLVVLCALTLFRPAAYPAAPVPTSDVQYWDLPNGSRLAYTHDAPATASPYPPVVFLHGGPGVPGEPGGAVLSGPDGLVVDGFDVYVYDQLGTGRSSRLADARDYTVQRHVADLELIREEIGADRLVLVGHSWGSALAAHYLAAHPDRVDRVVFQSPGPMARILGPDDVTDEPLTAEQAALDARLFTPRVLLVGLMSQVNPQAARQIAGDEEMDGLLRAYAPVAPSASCDPDAGLVPPVLNFYSGAGTDASMATTPDPAPALRELATPALILFPECDFIDRRVAVEYEQALPGAVLVDVPDAGHVIQFDRPDVLLDHVRTFLTAEVSPGGR